MPNTPPFEALELVPLCSATIKVHSTAILENTPTGHLMIGEIEESTWIGERFSAHQRGRTAADWLTVTPDGVALVDVRLTLETTEGGLIFVEYTGRTNMQTGYAYTTPRFRTGAPGLGWLNHVQAVAKGYFDSEKMTVTYPEIFEMR
jgi:hypothetical protein|tara:strand:+ start:12 stop:452 length:441 start_codon:yes stop_codon:yes gene_type:complete